MDSGPKSPIRLALKIVSAQYRQAIGEAITDDDVAEIRNCSGEDGEKMSALDAACLVIRRELTRDRTARVQ
jgi:hypothetical protein